MGMVKATGSIGRSAERLQQVEFLVDTGSFYTLLPSDVISQLGIELPVASKVVVADSSQSEAPLGVAYLRLNGREGRVIVGATDVPMPLLGASALEVLGFKVDTVVEKLEPSRPFRRRRWWEATCHPAGSHRNSEHKT